MAANPEFACRTRSREGAIRGINLPMLRLEAADVFFSESGLTRSVSEMAVHPDRDLVLMRLSAAPDGARSTIPWWNEEDRDWRGELGEIAGYGLTEAGHVGELRFAVEEIVDQTDRDYYVNGRGESGACGGDSGGPLLVRRPDGHVNVLGVLRAGSASCVDIDAYVRLDLVDDWLQATVGEPEPASGCDGDWRACFSNSAVGCSAGSLEAEPCGEDRRCGFDEIAGDNGCLEPTVETCGGVSSQGYCEGPVAVRCAQGTIISTDCSACGEGCVRSPSTGNAECVLAAH